MGEITAHDRALWIIPTRPDTVDETTAGIMIERGDLDRGQQGITFRYERDPSAETNFLRGGRRATQTDQGIWQLEDIIRRWLIGLFARIDVARTLWNDPMLR